MNATLNPNAVRKWIMEADGSMTRTDEMLAEQPFGSSSIVNNDFVYEGRVRRTWHDKIAGQISKVGWESVADDDQPVKAEA